MQYALSVMNTLALYNQNVEGCSTLQTNFALGKCLYALDQYSGE